MDTIATLTKEFLPVLDRFHHSRAITMLGNGTFGLNHYKSVLREIYHYAKEDPQIQTLAAVHFRGRDRGTVKMFMKHALSEIGHDLMALDDLKALGDDAAAVAISCPLPSTIAFTAFPFYQINYMNPIGYLGYLYFLEFMPTSTGGNIKQALDRAGVPRNAMTFLDEHMTADVAHNKLMEEYLRRLVRTESDLRSVVYAMQVTGSLYADMLWGAIQSADSFVDYGLNVEEEVRI